jgi:predicted CoA-substrate-specific enzyme activase
VIAAGLDIGSRTIELVTLDDGGVEVSRRSDTTHKPGAAVKEILSGVLFDRIVATGYGRTLGELEFGMATVTEIKAYAVGARFLCPDCRTIIDVGGQDTKVISLDGFGNFDKFEMNDRCSAGTGKFLEVMTEALGYDLNEFGQAALVSSSQARISSMCTVFAESEVVSLLAKGAGREEVARGLHEAVATRTAAMVKRVSIKERIFFAGGGARNVCLKELLEEKIGKVLLVPEDPQMVGALGAALIARELIE